MKYYIYVSDSKLDMLSAQIPSPILRKIGAELKVDLKVLSLTLKESPSEQSRYSKLKVVTKYIDESFAVGTVDEPGEYFRGTMAMRWEIWPGGEKIQPAVFFSGSTMNSFVGLGGSAYHVVGAKSMGEPFSPSLAPVMQDYLQRKYLESIGQGVEHDSSLPWGDTLSEDAESYILQNIAYIATRVRGPQQRIEFLAKKLSDRYIRELPGGMIITYGGKRGMHVVAGTPIYVAQVN